MCLDIVDIKSRKIDELKKNGKATFYKVIHKDNCSIWRQHKKWKAGWNKSNRDSKILEDTEKYYEQVSLGFHVFLNREDARIEKKDYPISGKIIKVIGHLKDLVAYGKLSYADCGNAVFMRLFVPSEELKNGNNKTSRRKTKKTN